MLKITFCLTNVKTPLKATGNSNFQTFETRLAFLQLRQAFTKALIVHHFDPERYIRIETDAFDYAIGGIFSQLILESGQWYPVAHFSRKMIPAKIWYKTHNQELMAIVEAFKTWLHYPKSCKYEVLVFIDYNNLRQLLDTKSLSSRQVQWA